MDIGNFDHTTSLRFTGVVDRRTNLPSNVARLFGETPTDEEQKVFTDSIDGEEFKTDSVLVPTAEGGLVVKVVSRGPKPLNLPDPPTRNAPREPNLVEKAHLLLEMRRRGAPVKEPIVPAGKVIVYGVDDMGATVGMVAHRYASGDRRPDSSKAARWYLHDAGSALIKVLRASPGVIGPSNWQVPPFYRDFSPEGEVDKWLTRTQLDALAEHFRDARTAAVCRASLDINPRNTVWNGKQITWIDFDPDETDLASILHNAASLREYTTSAGLLSVADAQHAFGSGMHGELHDLPASRSLWDEKFIDVIDLHWKRQLAREVVWEADVPRHGGREDRHTQTVIDQLYDYATRVDLRQPTAKPFCRTEYAPNIAF